MASRGSCFLRAWRRFGVKLELGSGKRPTVGYVHNDAMAFDGIDIVANSWEIDLPDDWFDEVIAIAFIEHLRYDQATATFANMRRLLKPGGLFLFDVPNLGKWCEYYNDPSAPFDREYVLRTIYGWGRWPGDSHQSGGDEDILQSYLIEAGFSNISIEQVPIEWLARDIYRYRFTRPQEDAHFYIRAQ